jgi:hypothetical protein
VTVNGFAATQGTTTGLPHVVVIDSWFNAVNPLAPIVEVFHDHTLVLMLLTITLIKFVVGVFLIFSRTNSACTVAVVKLRLPSLRTTV